MSEDSPKIVSLETSLELSDFLSEADSRLNGSRRARFRPVPLSDLARGRCHGEIAAADESDRSDIRIEPAPFCRLHLMA